MSSRRPACAPSLSSPRSGAVIAVPRHTITARCTACSSSRSGGQPHREALQPVVQILAETALLHHLRQVAVGRCHHPHVGRQRLRASHPLEGAFLQQAQEFGLRLQTHVADLVEKQHPAFGQLHLAQLARDGAGEGPPFVAEQLTFHQGLWKGAAVDLNKGTMAARALSVQGAGSQSLARAGLTQDQHGHIGPGNLGQLRLHSAQHRALPHELVGNTPGAEGLGQSLDAGIGYHTQRHASGLGLVQVAIDGLHLEVVLAGGQIYIGRLPLPDRWLPVLVESLQPVGV